MLIVKARLPVQNLPIRKVLAKLFQAFIYSKLDSKEHEGYKHPNGKVFKSMNFKINYFQNEITIKYSALDKANEQKIAMAIISDGLKLGEIHIADIEISLLDRKSALSNPLIVKGFVVGAIKDGDSNKKIYLEPKSNKFQEILKNHTLQKYEALFNKKYEGEFDMKLLHQSPKPRTFFYQKAPIKAWHGVYEIRGNNDILEMILDTGLGANAMQGLGFVEVVEEKKGKEKKVRKKR